MTSPAWVRSSSPTTTRQGSRPRELLGAADGVVVGDAQHVDPALDDGLLQLVGRRRGVARPHRVAVEVDPDPARPAGRGEVRVPGDRRGLRSGHPGEGTVRRGGAGDRHGRQWLLGPRGGPVRRRGRLGRHGGRPPPPGRRGRRVGGRRRARRTGHAGIVGTDRAGCHDPCGLPAERARRRERDRRRLGGRRRGRGGRGGALRAPLDRPRLRRPRRPLHRRGHAVTGRRLRPLEGRGRGRGRRHLPGCRGGAALVALRRRGAQPGAAGRARRGGRARADDLLHRRGPLPVTRRRRGRRGRRPCARRDSRRWPGRSTWAGRCRSAATSSPAWSRRGPVARPTSSGPAARPSWPRAGPAT